jgi:tetratricopeptide (TPR) repeat protein
VLTRALVRASEGADLQSLTYSEWLNRASAKPESSDEFVVAGDRADGPILENHAIRAVAFSLLTRLGQKPVADAISLLSRMIEQRDQQGDTFPEGRLNLGVAYAAVGDYERALPLLGRAVALYTDQSIFTQEFERNSAHAKAQHDDAHYQFGRALFVSKADYSGAVSSLTEAVRLDPGNARAYYYLGQAIRAMVETNILAKAAGALTSYLERGAPLGHEDEVREFLGARKRKPPT